MTYKINNTELTVQPSDGAWRPREELGVTPAGRIMYAPVREFDINWSLLDVDEFKQLVDFYDSISVTGTVVVDLPKWNSSTYVFESYTGCIIDEPSAGQYFSEHQLSVTMRVRGIVT